MTEYSQVAIYFFMFLFLKNKYDEAVERTIPHAFDEGVRITDNPEYTVAIYSTNVKAIILQRDDMPKNMDNIISDIIKCGLPTHDDFIRRYPYFLPTEIQKFASKTRDCIRSNILATSFIESRKSKIHTHHFCNKSSIHLEEERRTYNLTDTPEKRCVVAISSLTDDPDITTRWYPGYFTSDNTKMLQTSFCQFEEPSQIHDLATRLNEQAIKPGDTLFLKTRSLKIPDSSEELMAHSHPYFLEDIGMNYNAKRYLDFHYF